MIKNIALRIISYRVRKYLPVVNSKIYKKVFSFTYKFFVYLKPSQLWFIVLALLNRTDLKKLVSIPSMFILFNSIFSSTNTNTLNEKALLEILDNNKLTDKENN